MSSFNYIAILGRQPELGVVELESLLGADGVLPFGRQAALLKTELDIGKLGGAVKLGVVLYRGPATSLRELPFDLGPLPQRESKTPFGLSVYGGRETPRDLLAAGLTLKKQLRARGSVRLVKPAMGMALSAAELHHNHVLEDGFELVVVFAGREMVVAKATGVQDIGWYSKRDYERPARSAKVGMLPPKLAQVMVNSTSGPVVADPFCGTGVVLAEALLLGREAQGSDAAPEMVDATTTNLQWLEGQVDSALPLWQVAAADAKAVRLPENCSVVSEGYLGKNLSRSPTPQVLGTLRRELLDLYKSALANWARQLGSGAEVTVCVPAWRVAGRWHHLGLIDELGKLGYTPKSFQHVRTPILYSRDDQVVGRQILMLRKN